MFYAVCLIRHRLHVPSVVLCHLSSPRVCDSSLQNKLHNWRDSVSIVDLLVDEVSLLHTYYRDYAGNIEVALHTVDQLMKDKAAFRSYYKVRYARTRACTPHTHTHTGSLLCSISLCASSCARLRRPVRWTSPAC